MHDAVLTVGLEQVKCCNIRHPSTKVLQVGRELVAKKREGGGREERERVIVIGLCVCVCLSVCKQVFS